MAKSKAKYFCRVRPVSEEKLEKLYEKTNKICQSCMHDCKNENIENNCCQNRQEREDTNTLITMLKNEQVNLLNLCNDYSLKLNILIDMLRGNRILSYKYYWVLKNRLHMVDDEYEMNEKYRKMFLDKTKDGE